jgi:hypothetical protein
VPPGFTREIKLRTRKIWCVVLPEEDLNASELLLVAGRHRDFDGDVWIEDVVAGAREGAGEDGADLKGRQGFEG